MEPFLLGSICGRGGIGGIERRAECASKANITPWNRRMTHNLAHPTLIPSLTPFSLFQAAHTHITAVISHLLARSHCLAVSLSLPLSVHLLHSLFPHVYLRLPAYSHMALLTQLCHTHPTCCVPPRSDRCCSLGCVSSCSHLSDNFLFWLITVPSLGNRRH